jgi:hypothetical protein
MTNKEDSDDLHALLQAHRRTLADLLTQQAMFSPAYVPPSISHGIRNARAEIQRTKRSLRDRGIAIGDHPNDEAPATHDAGEQRQAAATRANAVATQRKLIRKIVPVDRDEERLIFQRMLRHELPYRGMIIHSNGEGGWGKSSLLKIFDEACADCPSPITEALLFTPGDTGADWRLIMECTVHALGESYFPRYRAASAKGSAHDDQVFSYGMHNEEEVNTPEGSDVIGRTVGSGIRSLSRLGPAAGRSDQLRLTPIFLEEFRTAPKPEQFVWLVDAVEQLDDDTEIWLRKIFRHIALGELQNIILVLAGRHRFNLSQDWGDRINQIRLGPLNSSAVEDLLVQGGWDGTDQERRVWAERLIKQTGGKPHAIRGLLDRMLIEQEV